VTAITTRHTALAQHDQQQAPATVAAARWGLTATEWTAYERIMHDRRGVWSPGLDPLTALGVSADTATDRKRYAERYVRTEFERTRKELAFQQAVDQAWTRLYPASPRIAPRTDAALLAGPKRRYALIVTPDCAACERVLAERLAGMLDEAAEGVDVHVVGTGADDLALTTWVADQPQLLEALHAGRATVNHGDAFQDLPHLPVIYSKTGTGRWAREL
jgi:integrating conjugative element protein (TIGR03759 family)